MTVAPPAEPESAAVWVVVTAETATEKPTLEAPAGMVTDAGTATALSLLDKLTASPLLPAGALNVIVQVSLPEPENELVAQLRPLNASAVAIPVPARLIATVLGDALSVKVMFPLIVPASVGSKTTERVAV